jgi:hypothetical protein
MGVTDVTYGAARVMVITVETMCQAHRRSHQQRAAMRCHREPNMTASFTSKLRRAGRLLACAVALSAMSARPGFAFSAEAQQMCTGDAFRLCSSEIPDIPKITACMYKHRAQLSTGCRTVMDRDLKGKVAESE